MPKNADVVNGNVLSPEQKAARAEAWVQFACASTNAYAIMTASNRGVYADSNESATNANYLLSKYDENFHPKEDIYDDER